MQVYSEFNEHDKHWNFRSNLIRIGRECRNINSVKNRADSLFYPAYGRDSCERNVCIEISTNFISLNSWIHSQFILCRERNESHFKSLSPVFVAEIFSQVVLSLKRNDSRLVAFEQSLRLTKSRGTEADEKSRWIVVSTNPDTHSEEHVSLAVKTK